MAFVLISQIQRGGWVGVFSWEQLAMQIVVKSGVLSMVTMAIDLYWQMVLPMFGRDYNACVYRMVGGMPTSEKPKEA